MFKRIIASLTLAMLLLATSSQAQDSPNASVSRNLQGRWEMVAGVNQGQELSDSEVEGTYLTVTNNTIVTYDRDQQQRYRAIFRIDELKKPMQITMTSVPQTAPTNNLKTEDQVDNTVVAGIMKFDGESRWTLCYALPGADRPDEFQSPKGSKIMLFTLEKQQGDPVPNVGVKD